VNAHSCDRDDGCEVNSVLVNACEDFVNGRMIVEAVEQSLSGDLVAMVEGVTVQEKWNLVVPNHLLEVRNILNATDGYDNDEVIFQDLVSEEMYEAIIFGEGIGTVSFGDGITYNLSYVDDSNNEFGSYISLDYPQTFHPDRMDLRLCF
jgi:hypothetical protein